MYDADRVQWWLERSRSPEYQKAYDKIADHLPIVQGGVFVDVTCGPGEMLKRVHTKGYELIIGADASREMMGEAQRNLERAGIEAKLELNASRVMNHRGVVLIQDDLIDSRLPDEIADVALFTFPELGISYSPCSMDSTLIRRYKQEIGGLDTDLLAQATVSLRADHHLSRIAKAGKTVIVVSYDVSLGATSPLEKREMEREAKRFGIVDLDYTDNTFVQSYRIWKDTVESKHHKGELDGVLRGYRIMKCRKKHMKKR